MGLHKHNSDFPAQYCRLFAAAAAGGGMCLVYTKQGKFARRGEAARFASSAAAERRGRWMLLRYPILRGFRLWAV